MLIDTGRRAGFGCTKGTAGIHQQSGGRRPEPDAIDTVIISHYHRDHVDGLLKADNSPAFPNAESSCRP